MENERHGGAVPPARRIAVAVALGACAVLSASAAPAAAQEVPMQRWLVVCLDGTWNNAERSVEREGGHSLYKPTNVLKLYRAVLPMAPDGVTSQLAYYNEGVGAFIGEKTRLTRLQTVTDRVFGGAFGGGFEGRVKEAYRFLVGNYRPGDRIAVFGFSRGSAQARSLVRFVDWTGGLVEKRDEYYIPELFEAFRDAAARPGAAAGALAAIRTRRGSEDAIGDPRPVAIDFLGVWDTVFSLGSRLGADRSEGEIHGVGPRWAFHLGSSPPAIVRVARQAMAIDESRWDYRVHAWKRPGAPGQSLVQTWFPGVHTNVGGGRQNDGLANAALHWMADEAEAAGLALDREFLKRYRPWWGDDRPTRPSRLFRFVDWVRGKRGDGVRRLDHGPDAGVQVHRSAFLLLIDDDPERPRYRPANLLEYLGAHPEAMDGLREEERGRVEAVLRSTVEADRERQAAR